VADFHVYRSRQNGSHFVAVLANDRSANAEGVRRSQNLSLLMTIPDEGRPHLGFDPAAAKSAIRDHGFYAFALSVEPRDHFE
jgi:hypothetical protein